jgi:hypothetical protein
MTKSLGGGHNVYPDLDVTHVADAPAAAYVGEIAGSS